LNGIEELKDNIYRWDVEAAVIMGFPKVVKVMAPVA
jgi:hypothetical protein